MVCSSASFLYVGGVSVCALYQVQYLFIRPVARVAIFSCGALNLGVYELPYSFA